MVQNGLGIGSPDHVHGFGILIALEGPGPIGAIISGSGQVQRKRPLQTGVRAAFYQVQDMGGSPEVGGIIQRHRRQLQLGSRVNLENAGLEHQAVIRQFIPGGPSHGQGEFQHGPGIQGSIPGQGGGTGKNAAALHQNIISKRNGSQIRSQAPKRQTCAGVDRRQTGSQSLVGGRYQRSPVNRGSS